MVFTILLKIDRVEALFYFIFLYLLLWHLDAWCSLEILRINVNSKAVQRKL